VLLLLVGLGAGWLAATLVRRGPEPTPRRIDRAPAPASDPRLDVVLARLDAIERSLRARPDSSPAGARTPESAPPAPEDGNDASPPDPWPGIDADELLLQAKVVASSDGQSARALEMYRAVTRRDVGPERKATALLGIADVYRDLHEYGAAARAFREARDVAGAGTEQGQSAWRQLGWALASGGQSADALREAEALRGAPGLSPLMRANADWMVALFAKGAGDVARARREFEAIVSRYADHPEAHLRDFAKMANDALADLE